MSIAPVFDRSVLILYSGSWGLLDEEKQTDGKTRGVFRRVFVRGIDPGRAVQLLSLSNPGSEVSVVVIREKNMLHTAELRREETRVWLTRRKSTKIETDNSKAKTWVAAAVCRPGPDTDPPQAVLSLFGFLTDAAGEKTWYCRRYTVDMSGLGIKKSQQQDQKIARDRGALTLLGSSAPGTRPRLLVDAGGLGIRYLKREQDGVPVCRDGLALWEDEAGNAAAFFFTRRPGSANKWDDVGFIHFAGANKGAHHGATWEKPGRCRRILRWFGLMGSRDPIRVQRVTSAPAPTGQR